MGLLAAVSLLLLGAGELRAGEDWLSFYPLKMGAQWVYTVTYKDDTFIGTAIIERSYIEDGAEYFVMRSDEKDVEYHIRTSAEGVFVTRWRFPVPFLKLFRCTVKFNPPLKIISYPLEVGKKWEYVGRGSVWFLRRNVRIAYEVREKGTRTMSFGDVDYYLIATARDDDDATIEDFYYYGRGLGYIGGSGPDHLDVLMGYYPEGLKPEPLPVPAGAE